FVLRAGKAIVLVVVVLNTVNTVGVDGSLGNENTERSLLSAIGRSITPLFEPMGLREENWPATVGIFTGIFAKEVVVGTLDALYSSLAAEQGGADDEPRSIGAMVAAGLATIPANLAGLGDVLTDPLGIGVGDLSDQRAA